MVQDLIDEKTITKHSSDVTGLQFNQFLARQSYSHEYTGISSRGLLEHTPCTEPETFIPISKMASPVSRNGTKHVWYTLLTQAIFDFHMRYAPTQNDFLLSIDITLNSLLESKIPELG